MAFQYFDESKIKEITKNHYKGKDIQALVKKELIPVEALAMRQGQKNCLLHGSALQSISLKYRRERKTFGMQMYYCKDCQRLFVEESRIATYQKMLNTLGIMNTFFPLDLTEAYLRGQRKPKPWDMQQPLYLAEFGDNKHTQCPVHHTELEPYRFYMVQEKKRLEFKGFYCEECGRYYMSRKTAAKLEKTCKANDFPLMPLVETTQTKQPKPMLPVREIKPDYVIRDGKKTAHTYGTLSESCQWREEDTIVIASELSCGHKGHEIQTGTALLWIRQKKSGRKSFQCTAGYCAKCGRYYMTEKDYQVIAALGRPEATILFDVPSEFYPITSGEVFHLEENHLNALENGVQREIEAIHSQPDYVSRWSVGSYDEGNLNFAKNLSLRKYGEKLDRLEDYKAKPYSYRVDITTGEKSEVYYLGAKDIQLDGEEPFNVLSYHSPLGSKLVRSRNRYIKGEDGQRYEIKLRRQFDVEGGRLYGYKNLFTNEDRIYRAGITDPVLIRVLNYRKKQHDLVDIIATIQENQNQIVDEPLQTNLIVQGCAGSGKTMVLLHRLSALLYVHPEYDFSRTLILTPNEQFNLHIQGVVEDLQIGNIQRISVEEYYQDMLEEYTEEFARHASIRPEEEVDQGFVDYIYSDEFLDRFKRTFRVMMKKREMLLPQLDHIAESMGEHEITRQTKEDDEGILRIRRRTEHYYAKIKELESGIIRAEERIRTLEKRKTAVSQQLALTQDHLALEAQAREKRQKELEEELEKQQQLIERIIIGVQKVNHQPESEDKEKDATKLKQMYNYTVQKKQELQKELEQLQQKEVPSKQPRMLLQELDEIERQLEATHEVLRRAKTKEEIAQIKVDIEEVLQQLDEFSMMATYRKTFEETVAEYKAQHKIKTIHGVHRYDLYAQLWFCLWFFGRQPGDATLICVDEGQDLAYQEYRLLAELNQNQAAFNIYGDTNQLLKEKRGIRSWERLRDTFRMKEYALNENYRNTNQITRFCNHYFQMNVTQTGVDGVKVRKVQRSALEKVLMKLPIGSERVAILVSRDIKKEEYLNKAELSEELQEVIRNTIGNGIISVMYVDEVKGIEFDRVFAALDRMSKNERYIAFTRALSELILVVDEKER